MKKIPSVLFRYSCQPTLSLCLTVRLRVISSILMLSFLNASVNTYAQFTKLMDFTTATSGRNLAGSLVSDGTFLYGMAVAGGANDAGTIFKIRPDGTGYVKLQDFEYTAKGIYPLGSLIFDGPFLYGTTSEGGTNGGGTIFKIKPDGTAFTKLLDFNGTVNGAHPSGTLISDGTFMYGTTEDGGANGLGTIFKIKFDGTGFTKLLDFESATSGRNPRGSLILEDMFLYGMTSGGGVNNWGVIFKLKLDGTGFVKLLDFAGVYNGNAGLGSLISDGTFLYGMTTYGGANNMGIIFKIKPDGSEFVKLLDFAGIANGNDPHGSLIFNGTFLFGMTGAGGANGQGIIFKIKPDGSGFSNLFNFSLNNGAYPKGSLISDGTFLYGMTDYGGINGAGIIFKFSDTPVVLPSITDFTPSSGPVGTTVIITGTNFSSTPADNAVRFNGTLATVTACTTTSITATVPAGTSTGTVTVTVAGNTATSASSFIVTVGVVTGIEQQNNGWEIYPNPFIATLSIKGVSKEKIEIEIVDVLGRSVKRISKFDSDTISLEGLEDGSYFLNIHTAKHSTHFRITKTH